MTISFTAAMNCQILLLLLAAGCKAHEVSHDTPTLNNSRKLSPQVSEILAAFEAAPDEAHFQQIVALAAHATDAQLMTVSDYAQYSKKCLPVDDPTVNMAEIATRLKGRSFNDFRLIEEIMTLHNDPWRRWTIARFLGEFGDESSIPKLQQMFNDPDDYVRKSAREAVSGIRGRNDSRP